MGAIEGKLQASFSKRQRQELMWLLLGLPLGVVLILVVATTSDLAGREQFLEGRSVREWVRAYPWDNNVTELFRTNKSRAVPALAQVTVSRGVSLKGHLARHVRGNTRILNLLPQRGQKWIYATVAETEQRERDREVAVSLCGSLNEDAAAAHPALIKACTDPNWRVRNEAVKALLRTGVSPRVAVPVLSERMLQDSNPLVRYWAAFYIGLLHEEAEAALPALRQAAGDPQRDVALRAHDAIEKVERAIAEQGRKRGDIAGTAEAR